MRTMKILTLGLFATVGLSASAQSYRVVDTEQTKFFNNSQEIAAPAKGEPFYGQDAQFKGNSASYTDNGDGTTTDNITGLMWQKGYVVMSYKEALEEVKRCKTAGYTDWRLPSIKEAYSLIMFSGSDVSPQLDANSQIPGIPFVNTNHFGFTYAANGSRAIDSQMLSSTLYVGSTERETLLFGVNFADGRIKGYGMGLRGQDKLFMVRFVRGEEYGINSFSDNGNGTISDRATELMWSQEDSKKAMNWQEALAYAEEMNAQNYLGHADWRVPNAKELQSIVDYSRSPLTTSSAAIDPLFSVSTIKDESGADDYPFYWSSTTHENSGRAAGGAAVYVAFGRSLGNMSNMRMPQRSGGGNQASRPQMSGGRPPQGQASRPTGQRQGQRQNSDNSKPNWIDVHGAGSQRSDPKSGDPSRYSNGHGPQGDAIRVYNYVRLVRDL